MHKQQIREAVSMNWLHLYPRWVQDVFKRALLTEVLPPYAEVQVAKAIKVARAINTKLEAQTSINKPSSTRRHKMTRSQIRASKANTKPEPKENKKSKGKK